MCHITSQLMGKYSLGPFLPVPGTYPDIQGSKNGYFLAKSGPNGPGWLQARPVHLERAWCAISHPNWWESIAWGHFCQFQAPTGKFHKLDFNPKPDNHTEKMWVKSEGESWSLCLQSMILYLSSELEMCYTEGECRSNASLFREWVSAKLIETVGAFLFLQNLNNV